MPISRVSRPCRVRLPLISPLYEKGIRPLMQWARVDFPQPEGPAIRIRSPLRTLSSISYSVGFDWAWYWKPN